MREADWKRFWAKVEKQISITSPHVTTPCWIWLGNKQVGYGRVWNGEKHIRAHWVLLSSPVPKGMSACHHCDNRACVNPEHIFIGTAKQNAQDMVLKKRHPCLKKTHCKRGHQFTPENTEIDPKGHRYCRECYRQDLAGGYWSYKRQQERRARNELIRSKALTKL